jgi:hypothetical protein
MRISASDYSARRRADLRSDGGERGVRVLAESRDGTDANNNNQRQHDRVLDRCRAFFALAEINDAILHTSQHYETSLVKKILANPPVPHKQSRE